MSKKISKIVFLIMVVVFMFTFNTTSNAATKKNVGDKTLYGIMGDVDGNKKINSSDGELILNYATGAKKLSVLQKLRADINGDGKVNSIDALEIINYIQNLVTAKKLSSITIVNNPSKTEYNVGDNLKTSGLKIKLNYSDSTTKEVTSGFTCSPTTLNTSGTQKITVSYTENSITKTTTFNVTVKAKTKSVTSVKINSSINEVEVGKKIQLTATVKPDDATNKNVTWSSNKTNVATVDSTGKLKGIAEGTTIIIATAADGSNVKGEIIITVKKPVYTGSLKVNDKLMLITDGWVVYKTETAAKNLDTSNTNGTLKKNDRIVVMEIKDNVIKIAENKYIYYGSTAANSFKPYFTVKFNANGGTGSMSEQYIAHGEQTNLKANAFNKSGYTFNGWYAKRDDGTWRVKDKNGNTSWQTKAPEGGSYVPYNDKTSVSETADPGHTVTMYAQWKITTTTTTTSSSFKNSMTFRFTWYSKEECGTSCTGSGKNERNFGIDPTLGCYTYNGKVVLAAATNDLVRAWGTSKKNYIKYFSYNNEVQFKYKGKTYTGIILDSCGASMNPYYYYGDQTNILDMFFPTNKAANNSGINLQKLTVYYN